MSPFVALVKYAYVQSQLDEMLTQTKNKISSYLPPDKNIDASSLNPREISNLYAWVDEMYNGGYVLYGTRRFFMKRCQITATALAFCICQMELTAARCRVTPITQMFCKLALQG